MSATALCIAAAGKYEANERDPLLGRGASAIVLRATRSSDGASVAVKRVRASAADEIASVRAEAQLLRQFEHPHIVRLHDVLECETTNDTMLVLDHLQGGDLRSHLRAQGRLEEAEASRLVYQMVLAVSHMHSRNVVHRDLKLENFVFTCEARSHLVLIDLGMASAVADLDTTLREALGSSYCMAPEVILEEYNSKCDVWALGVVAYMLLCGARPFSGWSHRAVLEAILTQEPDLTSQQWERVSPMAIDFLEGLLCKNPHSRPSAAEALAHPWVAQHAPKLDGDEIVLGRARRTVHESEASIYTLSLDDDED